MMKQQNIIQQSTHMHLVVPQLAALQHARLLLHPARHQLLRQPAPGSAAAQYTVRHVLVGACWRERAQARRQAGR